MGKASCADAEKLLRYVKNGSLCYTDKISIYDRILEKKKCCHKKIKLADYNQVDNLNLANSFHTLIEKAIEHYRNIASKYLNRYNALFSIVNANFLNFETNFRRVLYFWN